MFRVDEKEANAKKLAVKQLERINELTGLTLRFENLGNWIVLCNNEGPPPVTWTNWSIAYKSLWSSVKILEQAYLRNTLLADNEVIAKDLAEVQQRLSEMQAERDLWLKAAIQLAQCIEPDTI